MESRGCKSRGVAQHEGVEELDASLALPLVSNASLAFLRRHLALTGRQLAPLEAATRANSQRIYAAETRLAAEASAAEVLPRSPHPLTLPALTLCFGFAPLHFMCFFCRYPV